MSPLLRSSSTCFTTLLPCCSLWGLQEAGALWGDGMEICETCSGLSPLPTAPCCKQLHTYHPDFTVMERKLRLLLYLSAFSRARQQVFTAATNR